MHRLLLGLSLSLCGGFASLAQAADLNVGVVISGEIHPGVYGRVELGNYPPPPLLYAQPVVIVPERHHRHLEPVYLHVPPGHAKNWRRYCGRYDACSRPVYFVRSAEYEPNYRREDHDDHGHDEGRGRGNSGKHKGH
ncbi:MAG: hypothetical protein AB7T07_13430 [Steroidobacteraceae bacterium]